MRKLLDLGLLCEVAVVVTAMKSYQAEGRGYMHVHVGDTIQLCTAVFESGHQNNLYLTYAYGRRLDPSLPQDSLPQGWFPIDVFGDNDWSQLFKHVLQKCFRSARSISRTRTK